MDKEKLLKAERYLQSNIDSLTSLAYVIVTGEKKLPRKNYPYQILVDKKNEL